MTLNALQLAAAQAPESTVRIDAGAGTGKTTTLIARALWLAERHERVRLTTFSRRGVRVLRSRLADLPGELADRIQVDTHHGLASALLRHHGDLIGWEPGWQVIDRAEQEAIERESRDQLDLFDSRLRRSGLRTYDQLLPAAVELLHAHPEIGREWSEGSALLVDEAHDSSALEWALDSQLGQTSLTAVGDPAQRIYGWRGALPLESTFEAEGRYQLSSNYRSAQEILDVANRLPIAGRVDLRAEFRNRGRVEHWAEPSDEALIERLLADDELALCPQDWAILSRTSRRLEKVTEILRSRGVPVRAPGLDGALWETPAARSMIAWLHVVANPHDSLHLARLLELSGWTKGQAIDAEHGRSDPSRPCSLWDWIHRGKHEQSTDTRDLIESIEVCRDLDYTATECASHFAVIGQGAAPSLPADLSPGEALDWLADPDRDEPEGEAGCYLGTVHSSKGEEYGAVVLLGMEEGSLPMGRWATERREEEERIAEERRLLYVGITRARDRLILARRTERWVRGRGVQPATPSRFLEEITPC